MVDIHFPCVFAVGIINKVSGLVDESWLAEL